MVMVRIRGRETSSRTRSAPRTAIASACRDVLVADRQRLGEHRGSDPSDKPCERPINAPGEVDGRRSGGAQAGSTLADEDLVAWMAGGEERHAHGPGDAQRRGAADREPDDGVDEVVHIGDPEDDELIGEARLVDEADLALDPVDGPVGHGGHSPAEAGNGPAAMQPQRIVRPLFGGYFGRRMADAAAPRMATTASVPSPSRRHQRGS